MNNNRAPWLSNKLKSAKYFPISKHQAYTHTHESVNKEKTGARMCRAINPRAAPIRASPGKTCPNKARKKPCRRHPEVLSYDNTGREIAIILLQVDL